MAKIHAAAAEGFQAGAAVYERARPSYPDEAIAFIVAECGIAPGALVLDLAAGTGKLTRLLVPFGARLVAAEPVEAMRRAFAGVLGSVPLVAATAEALPFRPSSFDAVVVGQAFHWFDAAPALAQIHGVLRPRGALALVWNVRDETDPLNAALTAIIDRYEPSDGVRFWRGAWKPPLEAGEHIEPVRRRDFPFVQDLDVTGVVERVLSVSYIATQPERVRDQIAGEVRALVTGRERIGLPYRTEVYWTRVRS